MDNEQSTAPAAPEAAPADEALAQELEEYKTRERERALLDDARAALRAKGLREEFAAFLSGADERGTAKNIAEFEKCWLAALGEEVHRRIPQSPPPDFSQPRPASRRRGIRKL